jgi:gas vesicle protein
MRAFGRFLLGVFLGGLIGSVLGLLLAPVSGNELRERVYDYCTNIRDEVKKAASQKTLELQRELSFLQKK